MEGKTNFSSTWNSLMAWPDLHNCQPHSAPPPFYDATGHLRSIRLWHMFSRDLTVLPAHTHAHPH